MIEVKILGTGCPNCKRLEAETRAALDSAQIPYVLTKVTEIDQIAGYGILATPGLVMNEQVVSAGKIPARSWIVKWAQEREAASAK
jgi:small redox-active disulfide protein 2